MVLPCDVIALGDRDGPSLGENSIPVIDFVSKKQSRVTRSTYTAELYSFLDLFGLVNAINLALTQILSRLRSTSNLASTQECRTNTLQADLIIDARSVFDSVCSADIKSILTN